MRIKANETKMNREKVRKLQADRNKKKKKRNYVSTDQLQKKKRRLLNYNTISARSQIVFFSFCSFQLDNHHHHQSKNH
jgi:hypothetical protein